MTPVYISWKCVHYDIFLKPFEKKNELKAGAINAFIYFGDCQFIAKKIISRETLVYFLLILFHLPHVNNYKK